MADEYNIFYKQDKLFSPATDKQPTVHVYGVGSVGSHVAVGLAKTGFTDIHVYDMDVVESDNIPAQFFTVKSGLEKRPKTTAISTMTKVMADVHVTEHCEKLTPDNINEHLSLEQDSIHIIAFDCLESRRLIASSLEGFPVWILDGRVGGFEWEKFAFRGDCDKSIKAYYKTLEYDFAESECGAKCLWSVNSSIAARHVADVLKIVKGLPVSFNEQSSIMGSLIINQVEAKE